MSCIKIQLETIKVDRAGKEVKKLNYFDIHAINITDWDLNDKANNKTCKVFLSGSPFEAFQVTMPKEQLVEKLQKCGVAIVK